MGQETAKWIPLGQIVYQYIDESNSSASAYRRLWGMAFRGLQTMDMDFAQEPKTRKLSVLPNKTIQLPEDYIQWSKVGVLNGNGEVATLRYNKDLTAYAINETDRVALNFDGTTCVSDALSFGRYLNYNDGSSYCNLFGIHSQTDELGQFKVQDKEGIILLDSNFGYDYVILEYISSPEEDENYLVPIQLREALIEWLYWRDKKGTPTGRRSNLGEKQLAKKEYYNERRLAKARINPVRLWLANDTIRLGNTLSIKG